MKNFVMFLLLLVFQKSYCQSIEQHELDVKIKSAHYDFDMFRLNDFKFGNDKDNLEVLHNIFVWVIIDGFDLDNPIDFNNFSIVENVFKIRQRADGVGFKSYYLKKVDLKDFQGEDNFLKYTQEGVEDNDHYYRVIEPFKKIYARQERFYPLRLALKKNKKREFYINFPVKNENSGEFSFYYKDKLIKTFFLKRGERLMF